MPKQQKRQANGLKYAREAGELAAARYWGHIKNAGKLLVRNASAVGRFLASQGVRIVGGARVALVTIGGGITVASVSTAAIVAIPLFGGIYYFSVYKYRKELERKMTKQEQDIYMTKLLDRTRYYMAQGMSPQEASNLADKYLGLLYGGRAGELRNFDEKFGIVSRATFESINSKLRGGGIDPETDPRAQIIWQEVRKGVMQGASTNVMKYVERAIESTNKYGRIPTWEEVMGPKKPSAPSSQPPRSGGRVAERTTPPVTPPAARASTRGGGKEGEREEHDSEREYIRRERQRFYEMCRTHTIEQLREMIKDINHWRQVALKLDQYGDGYGAEFIRDVIRRMTAVKAEK